MPLSTGWKSKTARGLSFWSWSRGRHSASASPKALSRSSKHSPSQKQIAEALEAAHEVGIIHRDVKPANAIVKQDGQVKVLDFGLAKGLEEGVAEEEAAETSPTLSFAATRAGVILGTASYMSPEQARGHKADRRSDIWSFGVVLFEMLSGKRLFDGDTPSDALALVLTTEPDWDVLPADVPPAVRDLLRRCLTRERKSRLQAIGEARIAIEAYLADR